MAFELRRYSTAGIAMATAGIVVISPMTVPPPDLHVPALTSVVATRSVDLTAFVNPLAVWGDVLATTVTDIGALGQAFAADPFPLAQQVFANQVRYANQVVSIAQNMGTGMVNWANTVPEQLQTIGQQLAAGQVSDAVMSAWGIFVNGVVGVMFPVLEFDVPQQVTQNIANVVKALTPVAVQVGFAVLSTMYQGATAFADIAQNFYNAARSGDIATAASELINAPANLTGAVLNGWGEGSKGVYGIFGSFGVVNAVMQGFKTIADAIKPPEPAPPTVAAADDPAAAPVAAGRAPAPAAAAVQADPAVKESPTPTKPKDAVSKEEPKTAAPAAADASGVEPEKAEPTKAPTTKPVQRDSVKAVPGTKHDDVADSKSGTSDADADAGAVPAGTTKPADVGSATKPSKPVKPAKPAAKSGEHAKNAPSAHQAASAG